MPLRNDSEGELLTLLYESTMFLVYVWLSLLIEI